MGSRSPLDDPEQHAQRTREEVDARLRTIMKTIHRTCLDASAQYGFPGDYVKGANIAGFVKVAEALLDQGLV